MTTQSARERLVDELVLEILACVDPVTARSAAEGMADGVVQVRAEAAAEERARLRAAVIELSGFDSFGNIQLADVLALLDEQP
jgi:hypothetical protein